MAPVSTGTNSIRIEDINSVPSLPAPSGTLAGMYCVVPVEVRISRFTLNPGTPFDATALPYPSLMYIETGASDCPGGAGRIVYGPDGAILDETTGEGVQHIPTGTTQYIPANVPDGAGNQGTELMSSILIEFVPVQTGATPTG